jgi:preprotein translocase subunit SecG
MSTINVVQIIIAIAVIGLILMQGRSSGLGGIFGGSSGAEFYEQRRGLESLIFKLTVLLIAAFIILSVLNLVL